MSDPQPPAGPGPSAASAKRNPERSYTGPSEHGGLGPRAGASAAEAERYFAKLPEANQPIMPRTARALGIGSWIVGGFACAYMILYADYGSHEHVFSPVRRAFHKYTADMLSLSQSERGMLGLEEPAAKPSKPSQVLAAGSARVAPPPPPVQVQPPVDEVKQGGPWWKLW